MKNLIIHAVMGAVIIALVALSVYGFTRPVTNVVEVRQTTVIHKEQPIFAMASYEIHYTGKIYVESNDKVALVIPTGYNTRYDYEANILIGTKQYPKIEFINDVVHIDYRDVELEVLSITLSSLELVKAQTSGWRWFAGLGIPIQEGIFDPIVLAINDVPAELENDEQVMIKAMMSLQEHYEKFYMGLNYSIETTNAKY